MVDYLLQISLQTNLIIVQMEMDNRIKSIVRGRAVVIQEVELLM